MATAVVSGRIDESVKRKADAVIRDAGLTTGEVIRRVWKNIALTKTIPAEPVVEDERARKARVLREFRELVESFPPINPEYADMSYKEILAQRVDDYYA